ncbi:hypothetical protein [Cohaesibacter sp. ES.047]|uniref:hypothetical protein n=1 Tax=Cohaesibacter sp. ES.047 TaxID=1798205 RepID=UPI0012FE5B5E|nr:hypothetical protein [Cohaesibacter sp. ES.047]
MFFEKGAKICLQAKFTLNYCQTPLYALKVLGFYSLINLITMRQEARKHLSGKTSWPLPGNKNTQCAATRPYRNYLKLRTIFAGKTFLKGAISAHSGLKIVIGCGPVLDPHAHSVRTM